MHQTLKRSTLVLSAVLLGILPSLGDETLPVDLSADQIQTLLSDNSLAGNGNLKDPNPPYDWIAHYGGDGRLRLRLKPEWGGKISEGRWWMNEDGHQCRQFETGHKKEGCWRFQREGKFVRFIPVSGTAVEGRALMIKGDALE